MLCGFGDELAHGGNAASEPTHVLDPSGCLNLLDGLNLVWVRFNPTILRRFPKVSSRSCTSVDLSLVLTTMSSI